MTSDILSKAFTTTRPLELEYRRISLFRETALIFEMSKRIDESDNPSSIEIGQLHRRDLVAGDF
jgi:hypothetical protein